MIHSTDIGASRRSSSAPAATSASTHFIQCALVGRPCQMTSSTRRHAPSSAERTIG